MDMGGAGTVAGAMHTIATRKAGAMLDGIVGLVEEHADGVLRAGDAGAPMKG